MSLLRMVTFLAFFVLVFPGAAAACMGDKTTGRIMPVDDLSAMYPCCDADEAGVNGGRGDVPNASR